MNATLYKCLFSDIHHISYIVNNVMLFLDYMELYLEHHYFVYIHFLVLVQLVCLVFFWLMRSVAVAICLPVIVLQLSN